MTEIFKPSYRLKEAKTFEQQIEILKSRNLIIDDEEYALNILKKVNYYRLSGYYSFYYDRNNKEDCRFIENTKFEDIYKLYCFDRELRLILFNLTQNLEIMFRTHLAYEIAHGYGVNGWECLDLFFDYEENNNDKKNFMVENYTKFRTNVQKKAKRSKEQFISHYEKKYNSKFPVWVIIETVDFGDISKLYKNMKAKDKNSLSKKYYNGYRSHYIENWLEMSVILRNICAHHGRMVGRKVFMVRQNKFMSENKCKGLFALILGIKQMMKDSEEWDEFVCEMSNLIKKYNFIDLNLIYFPDNWEELLNAQF